MKIAMLVSGGVDSSVALKLLKDAGHDITAFYLKIWLEDEMSFLGECPWEDDLRYVRAVCEQLEVPLEVVPFQKEYWERIISYTLDEVKNGRTPNPDVLCNTRVKFGAFYEYLMSRPDGASFERIASGHYAQTEAGGGLTFLKRSTDSVKDQTYFLSQLSQAQVARAMFPIGGMEKAEVRHAAERFGLPNAKRKDSQGLCFLGKVRFDKFLEFHLGNQKGDMVDYETGKKLGEHNGFWYFTIGQRKGIGLSGGPWYVVGKDAEKNKVFISNSYRSLETARDTFEVESVHWITAENRSQEKNFLIAPGREFDRVAQRMGMIQVKIRHGEKMYPCVIEALDEKRMRVKIDGADTGIAPGQFAVFYAGEYCLGGGVITNSLC